MPFIENNASGLVYMTSSKLAAAHAFTTRRGGVSSGIYESLNLRMGVGDELQSVLRNYGLLGSAVGFDPSGLAFSHQVHGTEVRRVTAADLQAPDAPVPYEADGLITAEKDVPLIIFTADCVPILLFDPVGCAVGAVHAGWRGTVHDIAGKAVRKMAESFGCRPADIRAAIGPCISACCYETGRDVADAVRALGGGAGEFAVPGNDKYMVDLKGLNAHLLQRAGLSAENIDISPECTSCLSEKYWSHRVTHGRRGSQASVIMLKGSAI
jgi:YfiH family protein